MTPSSRNVATTGNHLDTVIKVEGTPCSVPEKQESKEGTTTTTASASWRTEANVEQGDAKLQPAQEALELK